MLVTLHSVDYQVSINSMGAELKSFQRNDGLEFVWNSDPKFWFRSSPLCFPTIGNVRDNKTIFDGKEYEMPKHGFCKDMEFVVSSVSDSSATFMLSASKETFASYPFDFELRLTYTLENQNLHMLYEVYNKDTKNMPYHLGAHPGFMCPLLDKEDFEDYVLDFECDEVFEATLYDLEELCFSSTKKQSFNAKGHILPLCTSMFDHDAVFFPHTKSRSVKLVHHTTQKGIQVDYPDFHSIAFWTPANGVAPFLCIEPWNGSAIYDDEDNEFCHKRDLEFLDAGQNKSYNLTISLLGY